MILGKQYNLGLRLKYKKWEGKTCLFCSFWVFWQFGNVGIGNVQYCSPLLYIGRNLAVANKGDGAGHLITWIQSYKINLGTGKIYEWNVNRQASISRSWCVRFFENSFLITWLSQSYSSSCYQRTYHVKRSISNSNNETSLLTYRVKLYTGKRERRESTDQKKI